MSQGAWVLVAAVAFAAVLGFARLAGDGRFRGTHRVRGVPAAGPSTTAATDGEVQAGGAAPALGEAWHAGLGERATLVQFSSAFCAPCRTTRRVLTDVAALVPGVTHVEIDAEHHLDLVRRLGILRTPTTLVLDAAGREVVRASGAPGRDDVLRALARALPPSGIGEG